VGDGGGILKQVHVDDDVSDLIGVIHYDPEVDGGKVADLTFAPKAKKVKRPKTLKGWFFFLLHKFKIMKREEFVNKIHGPAVPVYDLDGYKNYPHVFQAGEMVVVTEKIHGSSARFMYFDGTLYAGSRNHWVDPSGGMYPAKALRDNPWIAEWCQLHEGFSLYGEVTPTQKGYRYDPLPEGKHIKHRFWLFDIRDAQGNWVPKYDLEYEHLAHPAIVADRPPVIYAGPYNDTIKALADGKTHTGGNHIREGIVIEALNIRYARGIGRVKLKLASNSFLEKDNK
jgi:hypothetical protein